jgi:hypothetical protein
MGYSGKNKEFLGRSTRASEVVQRPDLTDMPLLSPSRIAPTMGLLEQKTLPQPSGFVKKLNG